MQSEPLILIAWIASSISIGLAFAGRVGGSHGWAWKLPAFVAASIVAGLVQILAIGFALAGVAFAIDAIGRSESPPTARG